METTTTPYILSKLPIHEDRKGKLAFHSELENGDVVFLIESLENIRLTRFGTWEQYFSSNPVEYIPRRFLPKRKFLQAGIPMSATDIRFDRIAKLLDNGASWNNIHKLFTNAFPYLCTNQKCDLCFDHSFGFDLVFTEYKKSACTYFNWKAKSSSYTPYYSEQSKIQHMCTLYNRYTRRRPDIVYFPHQCGCLTTYTFESPVDYVSYLKNMVFYLLRSMLSFLRGDIDSYSVMRIDTSLPGRTFAEQVYLSWISALNNGLITQSVIECQIDDESIIRYIDVQMPQTYIAHLIKNVIYDGYSDCMTSYNSQFGNEVRNLSIVPTIVHSDRSLSHILKHSGIKYTEIIRAVYSLDEHVIQCPDSICVGDKTEMQPCSIQLWPTISDNQLYWPIVNVSPRLAKNPSYFVFGNKSNFLVKLEQFLIGLKQKLSDMLDLKVYNMRLTDKFVKRNKVVQHVGYYFQYIDFSLMEHAKSDVTKKQKGLHNGFLMKVQTEGVKEKDIVKEMRSMLNKRVDMDFIRDRCPSILRIQDEVIKIIVVQLRTPPITTAGIQKNFPKPMESACRTLRYYDDFVLCYQAELLLNIDFAIKFLAPDSQEYDLGSYEFCHESAKLVVSFIMSKYFPEIEYKHFNILKEISVWPIFLVYDKREDNVRNAANVFLNTEIRQSAMRKGWLLDSVRDY